MPEDNITFKLRYSGDRFNGARLPVDVLSDLPALKELLVAYAKDAWKKQNPSRARVPRGFDESLSLALIGIDDGSAIPNLNWDRNLAQRSIPGLGDTLGDIINSSFQDIAKLIDQAGNNQFPTSISSEHIRALNKLGAGLREDERIEFLDTSGQDGNVVYLDTHRRKKLITRVRDTYQTRVTGVGTLVSNDISGEGHISLRTARLGDIKISLTPEQIREEFDSNLASDIQFDLQVELTNDDKFKSVVSVYEVSVIDAQIVRDLECCQSRITEISELKDGWCDGDGSSITKKAVDSANSFISKRPALCAEFKIYPTEDGGILFEFKTNNWDYSIEFLSDGKVEMYGVSTGGTDKMEPEEFNEFGEAFISTYDDRVRR